MTSGGTGGQTHTAERVRRVRESVARDDPCLHNHQEYTCVVLTHDGLLVSLSTHMAHRPRASQRDGRSFVASVPGVCSKQSNII